MLKLQQLVIAWAHDRNLIHGSDPVSQCLKTVSELGELADGVNKNRPLEVKDGIGNVIVTLIILAEKCGVEIAWPAQPAPHDRDDAQIDPKICILSLLDAISNLANWLCAGGFTYVGRSITQALWPLRDIACAYAFTLEDCLEAAYNEIKDRKGRMVDGVFIKEGDNG